MKIDKIFKKYKPLCEFISKCFGENVEVTLHDMRDIEHSCIAIYNNYVSGRNTGAPMTNFGLNLLETEVFNEKNYVCNYKGLAGGKILRSSTFFIRDDDEQLIGLLCVNVDITKYISLAKDLENLAYYDLLGNYKEDQLVADFPKSVMEMINSALSEHMSNAGYDASRLNKDEKKNIIKELDEKGIFSLKGGLAQVALTLNISEPTIYRYLNEIKKEK
ncbi:MAG: PAS domain-containing protein [Fusobacteriaceae bacterium]|jgi:predicted transcriptional regulator YheO|nr:PAS domain-containing protein [Fusobacteriaceae bacterium]